MGDTSDHTDMVPADDADATDAGDVAESTASEVDDVGEGPDVDRQEATSSVAAKHAAEVTGSGVRWIASGALLAGLAGLGLALWLLLRPPVSAQPAAPPAPPAPTAEQVAAAKGKACGAYQTARAAATLRSSADPGPDPNSLQAEVVAVNARAAFGVVGPYLLARLDPATPAPLDAAIRKFADLADEVALHALGGVGTDDPAQAGRLNSFTPLDGEITGLCK